MRKLHSVIYLTTFSFGFFVLSLLILGGSQAYGWEIGLEQGESTSFMANPEYYTSSKYTSVTLREGYIEAIQGGWVGESYGRFIGISWAYRSSRETFLDLSLGTIRVETDSVDQLDGKNQFTFSLGVGRKINNLSVMLKVRHVSNGSKLRMRDSTYNGGMDIKMIYLGYEF